MRLAQTPAQDQYMNSPPTTGHSTGGIPIINGDLPFTGGGIDPNMLLLVGVIILCIGLAIWVIRGA